MNRSWGWRLALAIALAGCARAQPKPAAPADSSPPSCGEVLMVYGGPADRPATTLLRQRLEKLGCAVTFRSENELGPQDSAGKALVVLPESLHSDEVVARFRTAAIPVILMEGTLYKLLGMAGPTKGVDFGAVGKQKEIAVDEKAQDHPLAAGLRGTLEIATQPFTFRWVAVAPTATTVATLPGQPGRALIFAYEKGAAMHGQAAPARRIGFAHEGAQLTAYTEAGWRLLDAAVLWALGRK